jgi:L-serine deaminase
MEIQQMMECLLAKMYANQAEMKAIKEKTDANLKEIIEDMRTWQKDMKAD